MGNPGEQEAKVTEVKLIGVIRVSTETQARDDKAGIPAQREAIRGIAAREGATLLDIVTIAVDGAKLGATREWNEQILPRLRDANTHVAVWDQDRLIRADGFDYSVLEDLHQTRSLIYHPGGFRDLSDDGDQLIAVILAAMAGQEKRKIKRRTMAGKAIKRRRGEFPQPLHMLAHGVHYDRGTRAWSYTPASRPIRRAFELFVTEGLPANAVARRLGLPRTSLAQWLRNTIYQGVMSYEWTVDASGVEVRRAEGDILRVRVFSPDAQLVSDEMFGAAQQLLDASRRSTRKRRAETAPNIVYSAFLTSALEPRGPMSTGFVRLRMTEPKHVLWGHSHGDRGTHYVCRCLEFSPPRPEPKCGLGRLPAGAINRALDIYFERMTSETWFLDAVLADLRRDDRDVEGERKSIQKDMDAIHRKERRLVDLHLDGAIDRALYDEKHRALRAELVVLNAELAGLESQCQPDPDGLRGHLRQLQFDPKWDARTKRDWLSSHVVRLAVSADGVERVAVKLPATDEDTLASFVFLHPVTWSDLIGYDPLDIVARRQVEQGLYTIRAAAEFIGCHPTTLRRYIRKGVLAEPEARIGDKRAWTVNELNEAKRLLGG